MTGEARQTEVTDSEGATRSLAAMTALAEVMDGKVKAIVARISAHESSKPWGTAKEYGGEFEQAYLQGKGGGAGADFVKDQVGILSAETSHGTEVAHKALQGTVDLDQELSGMYKVAGSDSVSGQMHTTLGALSQPAQPEG